MVGSRAGESVILHRFDKFLLCRERMLRIHKVGPVVLFSAYIGSDMLPDRLFSSALVRTS